MKFLIIFCATYLPVFVLLGLVIAWLRAGKEAKKQLLVTAIFAGIIALVVSRIAGKLYFDPRPFVTEHTTPLIPHGADNGFPSDHALLAMTLTAVTYFFSKKIALGMFALTALIGIARVLAKVHSPIDIAGGWLFGIVGAVLGFYLMRYLFQKYRRPTPAQS
jgi:undecaprenyl-diphosphatase